MPMSEYRFQHRILSWLKYLCLVLVTLVRSIRPITWKHETVKIESLPAEVLHRVTGYLDWDNTLSLKMASKFFYDLINSKEGWCNVARGLEDTIGARLEEEPDEYTPEELQKWCLRRIGASLLWKTASPSMFIEKECHLKERSRIKFCCIIPGGRWMIVVTLAGFIYHVDLDSPERECQELVNLGHKWGSIFAIWVDDSKRRLSFRISVTDQGRMPSIDIYQVDLIGHGIDANLVAKHISNLSSPRPCYSATLNGYYYVDRYTTKKTRGIRIFHYEDAPACDDEETPHIVLADPSCVGPSQFLSFITTFCFVAHMYDSLEFFIITPSHDSNKPKEVNAIFSIAVPAVGDMRISPPYHSTRATRIVLFAENKFKGIYIPHNNPENSTITMLGEYKVASFLVATMNFGPSVAVVIRDSQMDFIHYKWNHDGTNAIFRVQRFDISTNLYSHGVFAIGAELCRMAFIEYSDDPDLRVLEGKRTRTEVSSSQTLPTAPPLPTRPEFRVFRPSRMRFLPTFLHCWSQNLSRKREASPMESLPAEILHEILIYLDWKSILSFKQTSKLFSSVTTSRLLWSPIVRELESTTGARLEEDLEAYTGVELQQWCLQRHQASTVWRTTHHYLFPYTKYDLMTQGDVKFTRIIPGGRWMIAATNLGFIYSIDLDSSKRKCCELINLERTEQHLYAIWVDHSKRRLSFRISATETNPAPYRVRIYQVDLVGHGPNARLTATLLSAFSSRRPSDGTALNNNYYIEQFSTWQNPMMKLQLIHYHEGCEEPKRAHVFETPRCVAKRSLFFHFITPFCFVVHMQSMLQFCVITPYENSFKPRTLTKVFRITITNDPSVQISLPFHFPHETRIVVFAQNEFIGMSVPHEDPSKNYKVTRLGQYQSPTTFTMCCGLSNTFVVRDPEEKVDIIRYEWCSGDDCATSFEVKGFESRLFSRTNIVLIEEEMCRIIFYNDVYAEFFCVLDGTPRQKKEREEQGMEERLAEYSQHL